MKTTRTEIVFEQEELIVINRREQCLRLWCEQCAAEVVMWPPDMATVVSKISARQLYRLVEAGLIHFSEDAAGLLLICGQSLVANK